MPHAQQLLLPFASFDFSDGKPITVGKIAEKLGVTAQHVLNLCEDGTLISCDLGRHVGSRRMLRVPVEEYRNFILTRLSGEARKEFIAALPRSTLSEIRAEIDRVLAA